MWRKQPPPPPSSIPEHIRTRVSRIETPDLMGWADQAIYTAGRYLTLYQRDRSDESLQEAVNAGQVLLAIMDEMKARGQA